MRILRQSDWLGETRPALTLGKSRAKGVVIHHSASPNVSPLTPVGWARSVRQQHVGRNGWLDVGYHFLISRSGRVLEGRRGSLDAARAGLVIYGAHAGVTAVNRSQWGICLQGNSEEPDWTGAAAAVQLEVAADLIAYLCHWGNVDTSQVTGHRDHKATLCPGKGIYDRLAWLRSKAHTRKVELMRDAEGGGESM